MKQKFLLLLSSVLLLSVNYTFATDYEVCFDGDYDNNSASTSVRFSDDGGATCTINPYDITWVAGDKLIVPAGQTLDMVANWSIGVDITVEIYGDIYFVNGKLTITASSTLVMYGTSNLACLDNTTDRNEMVCPNNSQITIGTYQYKAGDLDIIDDAPTPSTVDDTGSVLPINLISFGVTLLEQKVEIKWSTASEENNDYFTLERSSNGLDFHELTRVDGAGNSFEVINYSYQDKNPFQGVSYYRLKQTDYDGTNETFKVVAAEFYGETSPVKVIQLLDSNNELIIINNMDEENMAYMYDMMGRGGQIGILKVGENNISTDKFDIQSGMYTLRIVNSLGKVLTTQKFVVR